MKRTGLLSLSKISFARLGRGSKFRRHCQTFQFLQKIFQISGHKNCREAIFSLENEIFRCKNRLASTVYAAGHD